MCCLTILVLLWGLISFLFSLISNNPWLWFLWVFLGLLSTIILFVLWLYLIAIPVIKRLPSNSKITAFYIRHVVKMINLLSGVSVVVENKENLTDAKRVLYVSNHKSQMDPLFIYLAAKRPMTAAGKSDLWRVKPLLPLIYAMRAVKIDRSNDRETAKSILNGIKFMKEDNSIIIFPEGGIKTREVEQMVSIKAGAYKLATKSDAVIQPIALINSSKIATKKWYQRVKVIVRFLPPVTPEDYKDLNTHEIAYKVLNMVNENFPDEEKYSVEEEN